MAVLNHNIIFHGSATMPDDDTTLNIGGAIDKAKKLSFAKVPATPAQVEAVSENTGDTTQTLTVYGRLASGAKDNEAISMNGQTPAQAGSPKTWERILKVTLSAPGAGHIALMSVTNERTNTAQGGGDDSVGPYIDLDAGASATDDYYKGMVVRITSGTGQYQIREIIRYVGSSKRAYVNNDWDTDPDGTSVFEVAGGLVFDDAPDAITEIRRIHYDASANPTGGADKFYYEKGFVYNQHATLALTNAKLKEITGGVAGILEFDLESTLDGTDTNGAGNNRQVAPSGYTFDSADKDIGDSGDGNFDPQSGQGVWFKLTLQDGETAQNDYYEMEVEGQST